MKIKVYDYKGKESGSADIDYKKPEKKSSSSLLAQYIRVYLANQRQGTASAKTRSEVRGGGKKPWRQKGLGKARAGSNTSPLWRGGGVTHGPKPKSWNLKMTKTMRKKVFNDSIGMKLDEKNMIAFELSAEEKPSTKIATNFLKALKINNDKVLLVHSGDDNLFKSFRNIEKTSIKNISELAAYDIISSDKLIIEKSALDSLNKKL